ncbi:hypothetical protein RDV89_07990 [Nocardioides zeae]|uniref:Uncharacterized protein n=1 Tax=Nocardioides imazamoxiresistens TaxID=3231893 RepID=A0ABU3PUU4_9ACTN|nr:hypothetical protein [Nocardioides zeae]MDT9593004.1 hypothetical protein [Nocardioides zeae]
MASDRAASARLFTRVTTVACVALGALLGLAGLPWLAAMGLAVTLLVVILTVTTLSGFVDPRWDPRRSTTRGWFRFQVAVFVVGLGLQSYFFVRAVQASDRDEALEFGAASLMFAAFLVMTVLLRPRSTP